MMGRRTEEWGMEEMIGPPLGGGKWEVVDRVQILKNGPANGALRVAHLQGR